MVKVSLLSQYVKKNESSATRSSKQTVIDMVQPIGTPPIIHVIQRGPVDQH